MTGDAVVAYGRAAAPDVPAAQHGTARRVTGAAHREPEAGWEHPAKEHVEAAATELGWERPAWYRELKTSTAPAIGEPEAFASAAEAAGWAGVDVTPTVVDTDLHTPADLVGWRLGMAHSRPSWPRWTRTAGPGCGGMRCAGSPRTCSRCGRTSCSASR